MKMKLCVTVFLLLVLCAGVQLHAQQSDTNSVESIKAKAESGDANAQCLLAEYYYAGGVVPQDYVESVKWFRKAADQGLAKAQFNLGACYNSGAGVTRDAGEAVKWWYKAAKQGLPNAEFNLSCCYQQGIGVPTNYDEMVKWCRKAAEQGYAVAQNALGVWYEQGFGVKQDYVEAAKWYCKAAGQGNVEAQEKFAEFLSYGKGVPQDYVEALKWYRKAADQGDAVAQYSLGNQYYRGYGVIRDYVEADKWFNLASAQGLDFARKSLSVVEQSMTPGQIAEAQKLAREFVPKKNATGLSVNKSASSEIPTATGTGFLITDDGYLISNYHVVKDAVKVRLVTGAGLVDAKVVKLDAANDLALLKATGRFAPLPVAASRGVKLGGTVATVGFPNIGMQGFSPKLAKGEIASLSGAADDARYFQISVPVQPGNSGGALVDEHGNVVGVVSAKLDAATALAASGSLPENVNYAVKSSFLLSFLESVPAVSAILKEPITADRKFEDVVKSAQDAAVLVVVY